MTFVMGISDAIHYTELFNLGIVVLIKNVSNDAKYIFRRQTKMIVKVDGLVKRYGKLVALDYLSFDVKEGEIFGLLGPNGSENDSD